MLGDMPPNILASDFDDTMPAGAEQRAERRPVGSDRLLARHRS
jgi:hypothetical protein